MHLCSGTSTRYESKFKNATNYYLFEKSNIDPCRHHTENKSTTFTIYCKRDPASNDSTLGLSKKKKKNPKIEFTRNSRNPKSFYS